MASPAHMGTTNRRPETKPIPMLDRVGAPGQADEQLRTDAPRRKGRVRLCAFRADRPTRPDNRRVRIFCPAVLVLADHLLLVSITGRIDLAVRVSLGHHVHGRRRPPPIPESMEHPDAKKSLAGLRPNQRCRANHVNDDPMGQHNVAITYPGVKAAAGRIKGHRWTKMDTKRENRKSSNTGGRITRGKIGRPASQRARRSSGLPRYKESVAVASSENCRTRAPAPARRSPP